MLVLFHFYHIWHFYSKVILKTAYYKIIMFTEQNSESKLSKEYKE